MSETPTETLGRIADRALDACAAVIRDTADYGSLIALERLADKLNAWDAVMPGDAEDYERAVARLRREVGDE